MIQALVAALKKLLRDRSKKRWEEDRDPRVNTLHH